MSGTPKLSIVLPVHDGQQRIAAEVVRVLEAVSDIASERVEMVVVDDGSRDGTVEILDELRVAYPQVRVIRHSRRLGMEAAGQTGLERASGELVFIQEDDSPVRLDDLRRLYRMGRDETVVAARAQSNAQGSRGPLLRRLKAWGAQGAASLGDEADRMVAISEPACGLQMVRRPHLQRLASRGGKKLQLQSERITIQNSAAPMAVQRV